jgi:GTP-binding protein
VSIESHRSFVVADIPGLIEGASEGAGLGIRFLKHLSRTGLLLHVVDMAPVDGSDPIEDIRKIESELAKYSDELANRERWLLLNKIDLIAEDERDQKVAQLLTELNWQAPVFTISAISKTGTQQVCQKIMDYLEETRAHSDESESPEEDETE